MSEFNEVTVGRSPHDEECLINGLIRDFKNTKNHHDLNIMGGSISLGLSDNHVESTNIIGETLTTNVTHG